MSSSFIGKYEIISTLGRGSMGVVYKAQDPEIGRLVAIKTLKSIYMGDDSEGNEALARFRQESRSAGKLHHPNIVTIFEAGRTDKGSPFIVMEYIDGKSLESLILDDEKLDPYLALHVLAQVASAVDYAHSQTVIHRDIKPSNVIIDQANRPHLLDFGVAKLSDTSLTPAGTVVGTPSYMSPEQIRGEALDGRSDLFSFAVMAFEAFTGTRPFAGKDFTTVVSNIIHKPPVAFSELDFSTEFSEELEKVLEKGLAKDKDERFTSALEMADTFASVLGVVVDGTGIVGGYSTELGFSGKKVNVPPNRPQGLTPSATRRPTEQLDEEVLGTWRSKLLKTGKKSPSDIPDTPDTPEESGESEEVEEQKQVADSSLETNIVPPEDAEEDIEESLESEVRKTIPKFSDWPFLAKVGATLPVFFLLILLFAPAKKVKIKDVIKKEEPIAVSKNLNKKPLDPKDRVSQNDLPSTPNNQFPDDVEEMPSKEEFSALLTEVDPPSSDLGLSVRQPSVPLETLSEATIVLLDDEEIAFIIQDSKTSIRLIELALVSIKERRDDSFLPYLIPLAKHEEYKVRIGLLKVLGIRPFSDDPLARSTISNLLDDKEYLVRGFAAKSLASIGDVDLADVLKKRLEKETHKVVLGVLNSSIEKLEAL